MRFRRMFAVFGVALCLLPGAAEAKAPKSVVCESYSGRLETCEIRTVNGIALKRRMSKDRCIEGETFGIYRRDQMWVDRGCRGEFEARRFGEEIFTRPGDGTSSSPGYRNQAQPWVNPDAGRSGGSWQNPDAGQSRSPSDWAYLARRAYAMNKSRGVDDKSNAQYVQSELRKQGVDPNAIHRGGALRGDFVRGLRSWR